MLVTYYLTAPDSFHCCYRQEIPLAYVSYLDRERAERRQKKEEEAARREAAQPALFDF